MATVRAGRSGHACRLDALIGAMRASGFLTDGRVESALRRAPRHEFVPPRDLDRAYENTPLPTMDGQTISQPIVVSRMTELLDVREGQRILEVGTGSGWQAAVLSFLAGRRGTVYSVERHQGLAAFARDNLDRLGVRNVRTLVGDGGAGHGEGSPYDRIMVTAACGEIPSPLIGQLGAGGLLVAPVGDSGSQSMVVLQKAADGTAAAAEIRREPRYVFVPLRGRYGKAP